MLENKLAKYYAENKSAVWGLRAPYSALAAYCALPLSSALNQSLIAGSKVNAEKVSRVLQIAFAAFAMGYSWP